MVPPLENLGLLPTPLLEQIVEHLSWEDRWVLHGLAADS
jgi:hypothetical protein